MTIRNISGNSTWDMYKKKLMLVKKSLKPGPQEDENVDQTQTKDESWDDFEDVNDEMSAIVFQLVSQYSKMGGNLRTNGPKMSGGAIGDKQKNEEMRAKRKKERLQKKKAKQAAAAESDEEQTDEEPDEEADEGAEPPKTPTQKTHEYLELGSRRDGSKIRNWITRKKRDVNDTENPMSVQALRDLLDKADRARQMEENYESDMLKNNLDELIALIEKTLTVGERQPVVPEPKQEIMTIEKKLGIDGTDYEAVVNELSKQQSKLQGETGDTAFWQKQIDDNQKLFAIENQARNQAPRKKIELAFERFNSFLNAKLQDSLISSTQTTVEETQQQLSQKTAEVEEVKQTNKEIVSTFGEVGNTSIASLLAVVVKNINKMVRLIKLKRNDWRLSVVLNDLKDVRLVIAEYYKKFNEMDPSDRVMRGYVDSYKQANQKMNEMHDEFIKLIKMSNAKVELYNNI